MARIPLLAAIVLALVGPSIDATAQPAPAPPAGARAFQHNCGVCHVGGRIGPELNKDTIAGRESDLRTIILEGGVQMPAFKHMMSAAEVDRILAYLKTLDEPPKVIGVSAVTR